MIFFVHKKSDKHSFGPFLIPFVQVSPNIDFPKKFDSNSNREKKPWYSAKKSEKSNARFIRKISTRQKQRQIDR